MTLKEILQVNTNPRGKEEKKFEVPKYFLLYQTKNVDIGEELKIESLQKSVNDNWSWCKTWTVCEITDYQQPCDMSLLGKRVAGRSRERYVLILG